MICKNCSKEWNAKESKLGQPCPHCGYSVFTSSNKTSSVLSKEKEEKRQRLKSLYTEGKASSFDTSNSSPQEEGPLELCHIGYLYTRGEEGYPKDLEKAFQYYERSAQGGNGMGQFNLGLCYEHGNGTPVHLGKSFYWYSQSVKNGEPRSFYQLGNCYMSGKGVVRDEAKGYTLLLQAGEKGYLRAYFVLSHHTLYGRGTQRNPQKAYEYMKIAASTGDADAVFCLSMYDLDSSTFPTNYKQALKGILAAASQDFPEALKWQARFLQGGFGIEKDFHKAKEIYEKVIALGGGGESELAELNLELNHDFPTLEEAVRRKEPFSYYVLGKHLFSSPSPQEQKRARELLDIASNYEIGSAHYLLGCCYRDGIGGEVSLPKAKQCFRKGSDEYILDASCAYAICLQESPEDPDCLEKALHLLKEGASIGHSDSQYHLARSFSEGLGVPPSRKLAMLWFKRAKESGSEEASQFLENYHNS